MEEQQERTVNITRICPLIDMHECENCKIWSMRQEKCDECFKKSQEKDLTIIKK